MRGHRVGSISLATALAALAITFGCVAGAGAATSSLDARGSAEQVAVTGADPGATLTLVDGGGQTVATREVNDLGGALFRDVTPGGGYHVHQSSDGATTPAITVLTDDPAPPSTDIYDQSKKHVGRSPFAPNAAMVFVPSNITYHGFEPRRIEGVRKSVIVNYVTAEWRAREQLAFPDQPV